MRTKAWLLAWGISACFTSLGLTAEELPLETFFRDYEFDQVTISPNGKYLAALAPRNGCQNLATIDLQTGKATALTSYRRQNVFWYQWISDERLVFRVGSDEHFDLWALFAINRDGNKYKALYDHVSKQSGAWHWDFGSLLDPLLDQPDHILVNHVLVNHMSTRDTIVHPDALRMYAFTGNFTFAARNPGNVEEWWPDHEGQVRLASALEKGVVQILYRNSTNDEFHVIDEHDEFSPAGLEPIGFTADNRNLYVSARRGSETLGVYRYDPVKRQLGERLWQNSEVDWEDLIWDGEGKTLVGVGYESDRPRTDWLDPRYRAEQAAVDKALPDTINSAVSRSRDGRKSIYLASSDRSPGSYYLFERDPGTLLPLVNQAEWIKPEQMARMESIKFKSRDGTTLHGYLTLPLGSNGKNLPLVVHPHGGPWARDRWGFNRDVQFLANRGYAVLQVNFRGSTGYGFAFFQAGFGEWGLKMQDDITDGVKLLIDEGIADKNRVAIYGASYGGYAVMAGLVSTPELYRCGVNYVGVTDLVLLLRYDSWQANSEWNRMAKTMIGSLSKDKERLAALSPVNHVEKIQAPVLLAYGALDHRVDISQGKSLASALRSHNKKYEMIIEPNEGHGFHANKARFNFYRRLEVFLKENMK